MTKPLFKLKTQDDYRLIGAAVAVLEKLKSGVISEYEFDMSTFGTPSCAGAPDCGTIRCLGGWIAVELKLSVNYISPASELNLSPAVQNATEYLFYPEENIMDNARPSHGIRALSKFIKGNPKPWDGIRVRG